MKLKKLLYALTIGCLGATVTTSCDDMLDMGNEYVIYSGHELTSPSDTVTSVLGILNKLQAISVRTNLLGEVRADLVDVKSNAKVDLKDLADFNVQDDNIYNTPRDYYAVINNCNYFLAHANPEAGNPNRNEKYFKNEIAAVHSIRAWTYLQTVLAYGRVPYVVDPVLTEADSKAEYPMYELEAICTAFIDDLTPYVGTEYPDYGDIGGDINPRYCFFPTQLVLADLYLWRAAKTHSVEDAKQAAKYYYDFIMWDKSGKSYTTINGRTYWSESTLYRKSFGMISGGISYSTGGQWGSRYTECITAIPMDSAAADGYYNELRFLYNTTNTNGMGYSEACIAPSSVIRNLSKAQTYVGYDTNRNLVTLTEEDFSDDQLTDGYCGDLRLADTWMKFSFKDPQSNEIKELQSIDKNGYQHIRIYNTPQVYLRLAEALNYAGYPRFARQILTMGLSNTVIAAEVAPYYVSDADKEFLAYFDFNPNVFFTYAERYSDVLDSLDVVTGRNIVPRASENDVNMLGIHSRGCGLAFMNKNYLPLHVVDSTGYPYAQAKLVGKRPLSSSYSYPTLPKEVKKPSTWDAYPNQVVDQETYKALNSWYTVNRYNNYVKNDSVGKYNTYVTVTMPTYEADYNAVQALYHADMDAYLSRYDAFHSAYDLWYDAAYSDAAFITSEQEQMRQAILDEQALELAFDGNRFFDLMRSALWTGDNTVLADAVAKRNPSLRTMLLDSKNWFISWKGQIGF